jgi:hypothetical protein
LTKRVAGKIVTGDDSFELRCGLLNLIFREVRRIADILDMHFGERDFVGQLAAHPDVKERKN